MGRPALRRLLADIDAGRVDSVVVYKVERFSHSLPDFARTMELFDKRGISFASVTQQFSTTASLGRLTANILLSFAQFEREIIAERTREKMWTPGDVSASLKLNPEYVPVRLFRLLNMLFRRSAAGATGGSRAGEGARPTWMAGLRAARTREAIAKSENEYPVPGFPAAVRG